MVGKSYHLALAKTKMFYFDLRNSCSFAGTLNLF